MWYFILGFFIGICIAIGAFVYHSMYKVFDEEEIGSDPPQGKAEFIDPITPEERIQKATSIKHLLKDEETI